MKYSTACASVMVQVQLREVRQPVRTEYQQQSSVFSRVLSWLPWEPHKCNLRQQIDQEEYPPSIHMDLMYNNPSVKTEENTTLNVSYLRSVGCMQFIVNIKGKQLSSCVYPG